MAVKRRNALWYGELILCFKAKYRPHARRHDESLCLVRWLDTTAVTAQVERRQLTAQEQAGPFETFRWSKHCGSYRTGHPRAGAMHYGIVDCWQVRYRAPIFVSIAEPVGHADPLYRLCTDMMRRF